MRKLPDDLLALLNPGFVRSFIIDPREVHVEFSLHSVNVHGRPQDLRRQLLLLLRTTRIILPLKILHVILEILQHRIRENFLAVVFEGLVVLGFPLLSCVCLWR